MHVTWPLLSVVTVSRLPLESYEYDSLGGPLVAVAVSSCPVESLV